MFISLLVATLLLISYLFLRDRVKYPRFHAKSIQRLQKRVAKQIAFHNWKEAEKELKVLIESGREEKETRLLQLQVLRGTGQMEAAIALVNEGGERFPNDLRFAFEKGRILLESGHAAAAAEIFDATHALLRGEEEQLIAARAYLATKQVAKCHALLTPLLPQSTEQVLLLAGDLAFEEKRFGEAIVFYERLVKSGFGTRTLLLQLAQAYRRHGNLAEAEQLFRLLLEQDLSDTLATLGLGACFEERGQFQKALLLYQAGGAWVKQDPRLLKQAGKCALFAHKPHIACDCFQELLEKEPPSAELLLYYGYSLEREERWPTAERIYLLLTELFPDHPSGYRALSWLFGVGLAQTLTAEQGLQAAYTALKLAPNALSLELLSAALARTQDFGKAHQIQEYLASQEKDPLKRARYTLAMRTLRRNTPLDDHLVLRGEVA